MKNAMLSSRRAVLQAGGAAGGGLLLSLWLPKPAQAAGSGKPGNPDTAFTPNAFVTIDRQGKVTLTMRSVEMGQGIWTSSAMLIAEELEVDLDQVALVAAPADSAAYTDPILHEQATGGSGSTRSTWRQLREAGAVGRTMLVRAAAAQWGVDPAGCAAARATVTHTASGRTLAYGVLVDAAAKLPTPKDVPLKDPAKFTLIGHSTTRLDTPAKVNGTAVYGIDVTLPGMGIGTVSACPVRGGKLQSFNEAAARAVAGVRDVVALDDAVAVIGDHMWAAQKGLQAAAPVWNGGGNAGAAMDGIIAQMETASKATGVVAKHDGDVDSMIAKAAKRLEAVYQLPFLAHAPMEPINTTLHVRPDGADLWVGTQVPVRAQTSVAEQTGLSVDKVVVHNQLIGGSFGRRLEVDSVIQAARIAKHIGYPVKLIWTREEDMQHDFYRPYYFDRISAGLDAQGKVTGWSHRTTGSSVTARWGPPGMKQDGKLDPDAVESAAETPYAFPAQRSEWVRNEPKALGTAYWRGVGPTHNVFVVESFMDELAAAAGADPVEFRRSMLPSGDKRSLAVLNLAAEKAGWTTKAPQGVGRGVALQFAFDTVVATVIEAEVKKGGDIRVGRVTVAVDCGPVINPDTIRAQIQGGIAFGLTAALYGEITVQNGRVQQSNFHDYRMMRINETPSIEVHLLPNPAAPVGGIGEAGTVAAAPALANAIFAATGKRLRRAPFATGQLAES